jgi:hypothetical protein
MCENGRDHKYELAGFDEDHYVYVCRVCGDEISVPYRKEER